MFTHFERDASAETGVMFSDFITAVGIYVYTNESARKVTVSDIALVFNTTPELAREAVSEHPWLFVNADNEIQSDGE